MTLPDPASFLSGTSGHIAGIRRVSTTKATDALFDAAAVLARTGTRIDRAAREVPRRRVLVAGVYRPGSERIPGAVETLEDSWHELEFRLGSTGAADPRLASETVLSDLGGGKFENLNLLLEPPFDADWVVVIDDDVILPRHFLDRFVAICEAFDLELAQPAQTRRSHAAWQITRRRPLSLARTTRYVEIGPVTAFSRAAVSALTPFPELRYGWGLDVHWSAVAEEQGWNIGVVDALPVRHDLAKVGSHYPAEEAVADAQRFLADKPYVNASAAQTTLATHRRLPS